jgi:predicted RNase H-like HicB family nuclease
VDFVGKDYHINIFYSKENGNYIADIPDLEVCSAFGETPAAALTEIEITNKTWLETAPTKANLFACRVTGPLFTNWRLDCLFLQLLHPTDKFSAINYIRHPI